MSHPNNKKSTERNGHADSLLWTAYEEENFPALRLARVARLVRRVGRWMLVLLFLATLAMFVAPWQQSIRGEGSVIAFDPFERPQPVEAPVKGRIAKRGEGVVENAYVTKGQLLFSIEDQDPTYLLKLQQQVAFAEAEVTAAKSRLEQAGDLRENNLRIVEVTSGELRAMREARDELLAAYDQFILQERSKQGAEDGKLVAAEAKKWQAEADYQRKKQLFEEGIETQLKYQESEQKFRDAEAYVQVAEKMVENARNGVEGKVRERAAKNKEWEAKINKVLSLLEKAKADVAKADIDINKTTEEINLKQSKLLDQRRKLAVQQTQDVHAPRDGYIQNLTVFDSASIVKPGDQLCRIVPKTKNPAVQIWVAGNDAPLIHVDDHVRLQFEGWPAAQFSGWPSVAVGTFGGKVVLVDPTTDDASGRFRVLVVPDSEDSSWPEARYLRQGVRANGWVLLDQVPLGYEVWRRMNGFPPALKAKEEGGKPKPPKVKL